MSHYNSLAVERVWGVTTFIQIVVTYNHNLKFNIIIENSQKILKPEESTRDDSDTT
jgi:hypothetical protein